ncbi:MAG: hypothetical protein AB1403_22060 [Candidatus Riflebacteria bacterium]
MQTPLVPESGKGGKAYFSFNDGIPAAAMAMTLQSSFRWLGETHADKMYLLGGGKMINPRPGLNTAVHIDGIVDGLDVEPTANNDEVSVPVGTIQVDGAVSTVPADASVAVTRPAAGEAAWVGIHVNKSTGVISATKGADTTTGTGKTGLLSTFGSGAGQKPLIPTTDLLIRYIQLDNGAKPVVASEIKAEDAEFITSPSAIYPSIGGALLSVALKKLHTGGVGRDVKFTGRYWDDDGLALVGSAQDFEIGAGSNSITGQTLMSDFSESDIGAWNYTMKQFFDDGKALDAVYNRKGYMGIKLVHPSGFYWRFVGSLTQPRIKNARGAYNDMDVGGSIVDTPYYSGLNLF